MEYPSRAVHEVCPYWLISSEGLRANAGEHKTRKVSVLIAMSILAFMLGSASAVACHGSCAVLCKCRCNAHAKHAALSLMRLNLALQPLFVSGPSLAEMGRFALPAEEEQQSIVARLDILMKIAMRQ